jgi:hypothetical protein
MIDTDKVLDEFVKAEATNAEGDAVLAEIEARQFEILDEFVPGRPDVAEQRELTTKIATARRKRANGIAKRAGTAGADLIDMRLQIALKLEHAQRLQVGLEERLAHTDLYVVSAEEATGPRSPSSPLPQTAAQIELSAMQGRAAVQALEEWMEAHVGPDPEDGIDAMRQNAVDALKRWNAAHQAADAKPKK